MAARTAAGICVSAMMLAAGLFGCGGPAQAPLESVRFVDPVMQQALVDLLRARGVRFTQSADGTVWHTATSAPWVGRASAEVLEKYEPTCSVLVENESDAPAYERGFAEAGIRTWRPPRTQRGLRIAWDLSKCEQGRRALEQMEPRIAIQHAIRDEAEAALRAAQ